jgi:minor curlin subunit
MSNVLHSNVIKLLTLKGVFVNPLLRQTLYGSSLYVLSSLFMSTSVVAQADLLDSPLSLSLSTQINLTQAGVNSTLVLSQLGIHNTTTVKQTADASNSAVIEQLGDNNIANIVQDGFGNELILQQLGSDNLIDVIQQGDANIANVQQLGGQSFVVHQIGNEMVVNITQYKQ